MRKPLCYAAVTMLAVIALLPPPVAAQPLPYQNPSLTPAERAEDLLGRLSVEEKIQLMMNDSPALPAWGIQTYNWWSEDLHGCARAGLATVFPQAIGLAATFDTATVRAAFDIASTEQRIKYIQARRKGEVKRYAGLTAWTPNINIFRDPRWGRGQETYGEDPCLTAAMGRAVVEGLQAPGVGNYDKLHACLKHFAVHSGPEYERHTFDAHDIPLRDLSETYLYAFEKLVRETPVKEVMCAYNRYEGEPCCGSNRLLIQILRDEWGFDGLVVSDCGAIRDFHNPVPKGHGHVPDAATASADAVYNGTDLECGSSYRNLTEALRRGLIDEATIDRSVRRLLRARFELGEMDADSLVSWNHTPETLLACPAHDSVALRLAQESMVLLQNRNGVLPLGHRAGAMTYAVIGPNAADSLTLWGNYNGTPPHTVTVLDGIRAKLREGDRLIYRKGSEWVAREEFHSRYDRCATEGGQGFTATYWNNPRREGTPAATQQLASPFQLCTSGATVFAPGVQLEDFSARYATTYHADRDETLTLDYFVCGQGNVLVDGDTLASFKTGHGPRRYQKNLKVKAGRDYRITIDFAYIIADAQLNFDLGVKGKTDIAALLADTREADVYIYVGGISPQLEGEEMKVYFEGFKGGDRTDIELPAVQRDVLRALHATGRPVVYVNMSGSAIGLVPETESCDAIVQAWYGGQAGGRAVADVLFGDYNPAGRLPVTFYRDTTQLPPFGDYGMTGRTYRYATEPPLFPFGHGLSYTTFAYGDATLHNADGRAVTSFEMDDQLTLRIAVTNTGDRDGDEVVQVYIRRDDDTMGPHRTLRGFRRVHIAAGQTASVEIPLTEESFRTFRDDAGRLATAPGTYTIYYGGTSDAANLKTLSVTCRRR